jgi:hypothetical protein
VFAYGGVNHVLLTLFLFAYGGVNHVLLTLFVFAYGGALFYTKYPKNIRASLRSAQFF